MRSVYPFFTSCTSVSSLITSVQLNLAMTAACTLQLCQTATQHSEASFFDGGTDELDSVNKLKERTSARWDHFVSETAHSSRLARKFSYEPNTALQIS